MKLQEEILAYFQNTTIQKFLIAVLIFYVLDFVTGFSRAWRDRNIQSAKLRNSVTKAIQYVAFVLLGVCADMLFNIDKGAIACAVALCSIELKSLTENLEDLKIPQFILSLFNKGSDIEND